jgi:hypothetical protein
MFQIATKIQMAAEADEKILIGYVEAITKMDNSAGIATPVIQFSLTVGDVTYQCVHYDYTESNKKAAEYRRPLAVQEQTYASVKAEVEQVCKKVNGRLTVKLKDAPNRSGTNQIITANHTFVE